MIKLITPKRDLYMDGDTSNPEGLFGKKGVFYEVKGYGYAGEDIMFIDERGVEHSYGVYFVGKDFWTVDFDKGFEFDRYGNGYEFIDGTVLHMGSVVDEVPAPRVIHLIVNGLWDITRFSNQTPTPPEEIRHPYENWKKDIGIAKFQRCIDKGSVLLMLVDSICGYLDEGNRLFYYHKNHRGQQTYLCCKVSFSCADGWYFVRENKDSALVKESSDVLASFKVPVEESTPIERINIRYTEQYTNLIKEREDKILATFRVPDHLLGGGLYRCMTNKVEDDVEVINSYLKHLESSGSHGEEVSESNGNVCTSEEAITSDGGKSDYYKIVLPQWLLDKQLENGYIMLEDLTEVMFKNDFNYTNVFKAQKRMFELQQGKGKKGNTLEYDATKVKYYVDKQLEVFNRD